MTGYQRGVDPTPVSPAVSLLLRRQFVLFSLVVIYAKFQHECVGVNFSFPVKALPSLSWGFEFPLGHTNALIMVFGSFQKKIKYVTR